MSEYTELLETIRGFACSACIGRGKVNGHEPGNKIFETFKCEKCEGTGFKLVVNPIKLMEARIKQLEAEKPQPGAVDEIKSRLTANAQDFDTIVSDALDLIVRQKQEINRLTNCLLKIQPTGDQDI